MKERRVRATASPGLTLAMAALLASAAGAQIFNVGLSSVRAQRFGRPSLPNPNADGGDAFGWDFAAGDFNGDGAEDLATGVPESDGSSASPRTRCGAVVVRYGVVGKGLTAGVSPTVLGQFVGPVNHAEAESQFGLALTACNLNGDAYDDLIVGVPYQTVSVGFLNFPNAGTIEVYYGTSAGLVPPASTTRRESGGQVNFPTEEAHFGAALACADFNHDGFDDVAVGLPYRSLGTGAEYAGRVNVFSGSAAGLSTGAVALDQNTPGMEDSPEFIDNFGAVLRTGDFDGDGFADLAIGVASEAPPATPSIHSGAIQVVYGADKGLGTSFDQIIFESALNWPSAENLFGHGLAVGNFDADAYDDLVIGVPGERFASADTSGVFFEIFGAAGGLDLTQVWVFSQNAILGGGEGELFDEFGAALAAGDFDGDGADDLAIGTPGEDFQGSDDGAVAIAMGSGGVGLSFENRHRQILRGYQGFPGEVSEHQVYFGDSLATGDFDGNGSADLVIGAPREGESFLSNVGTETVLYGALYADGFETGSMVLWFPNVP